MVGAVCIAFASLLLSAIGGVDVNTSENTSSIRFEDGLVKWLAMLTSMRGASIIGSSVVFTTSIVSTSCDLLGMASISGLVSTLASCSTTFSTSFMETASASFEWTSVMPSFISDERGVGPSFIKKVS